MHIVYNFRYLCELKGEEVFVLQKGQLNKEGTMRWLYALNMSYKDAVYILKC